MIIELDTPTYVTEHSGCTYGDIFENCILPAFKQWNNKCEYTTFNTYPAIKLPWVDDSVGETVFPMFWISIAATTVASSGNRTFYFGVGGQYGVNNINCYKSQGQAGAGQSNWNIFTTKGTVRVQDESGAYHLGFFPAPDCQTNAPWHVTKLKKSDGTYENCMISAGGGNSSISSVGNSHSYNIQRESDGGSLLKVYPNTTTVLRSNVGQVVPIDLGDAKHEEWFTYFMGNTTMKGTWDNTIDILVDPTYSGKLWYPNAFTIGGQSFDAFILGCTFSASNYGVNICRKHKEG